MKYWREFIKEIEDYYNPKFGVAFWQCPECLSTRVCPGYDYHDSLWCSGFVFFYSNSYEEALAADINNEEIHEEHCNNPYGKILHKKPAKCEAKRIDPIALQLGNQTREEVYG